MIDRMLTAATLAIILLASTAEAQLFVDNVAGDDRNNGRTASPTSPGTGPVQTINRALALCAPGEHIVLANTGVPYYEAISLCNWRHCGYPDAPLVIEGNGAILDGSRPLPPGVWLPVAGQRDLFYTQPPRGRYWQLFRDGRPVRRLPGNDASFTLPALEPMTWCLQDGKVYLRTEGGHVPGDYNLSYTFERTGITLYKVHHVVIVDLVVQGFQVDGVNAFNGVKHCRLGGVTMRGNGRAGLAVLGDSRLEIDGCVIGDNGAAQVLTDQISELEITTSELIGNSAPTIQQQGGHIVIDGEAYREAH